MLITTLCVGANKGNVDDPLKMLLTLPSEPDNPLFIKDDFLIDKQVLLCC